MFVAWASRVQYSSDWLVFPCEKWNVNQSKVADLTNFVIRSDTFVLSLDVKRRYRANENRSKCIQVFIDTRLIWKKTLRNISSRLEYL